LKIVTLIFGRMAKTTYLYVVKGLVRHHPTK